MHAFIVFKKRQARINPDYEIQGQIQKQRRARPRLNGNSKIRSVNMNQRQVWCLSKFEQNTCCYEWLYCTVWDEIQVRIYTISNRVNRKHVNWKLKRMVAMFESFWKILHWVDTMENNMKKTFCKYISQRLFYCSRMMEATGLNNMLWGFFPLIGLDVLNFFIFLQQQSFGLVQASFSSKSAACNQTCMTLLEK